MKWSKRGCRDRGVLEADDQVPNTECSLRCSQFEPFRLPLADIKSEMLISIERLRVLNGNEDEDEWCWGRGSSWFSFSINLVVRPPANVCRR